VNDLPRFISVDDHVVEPPDLWSSRLPAKLRERGPHVVREKGVWAWRGANERTWVHDPAADGAVWADVWHYDDMVVPLQRNLAAAGFEERNLQRPLDGDIARVDQFSENVGANRHAHSKGIGRTAERSASSRVLSVSARRWFGGDP